MEIVLKSTKGLQEKIVRSIEEAASRDDSYLVINVDKSMFKEVNLELRGMQLGPVEYSKSTMYVTGLGVYVKLKEIDKYV